MNVRAIIAISLAFAAIVFNVACSDDAIGVGDTIRGSGAIVYRGAEGGYWAIKGSDGETYEPTNLPTSFRQEGLKVGFFAEVKRFSSWHGAGPVIELRSIWVEGHRFPR